MNRRQIVSTYTLLAVNKYSSCVRAEGSSSSNAQIGATTATTQLPAAVVLAIGNELRLRFAPDFQIRMSLWLGSILYDDANMVAK